jgi:hypothetical protein
MNHLKGSRDSTRCEETSRKNNLIFKNEYQIKISKIFQMWEIIKRTGRNEINVKILENM